MAFVRSLPADLSNRHAFGLIERRLLARHIGLGLVECILKAPLIDAEQLLAFAHLFVVVNKDVRTRRLKSAILADALAKFTIKVEPRRENCLWCRKGVLSRPEVGVVGELR